MIWEGIKKDPPGEASDPGKEKPASGWTLVDARDRRQHRRGRRRHHAADARRADR